MQRILISIILAVGFLFSAVTTGPAQAQQMITMDRLPNIIHGNWNPPSSSAELQQICNQQAWMNNINPQNYCSHVTGFCAQFNLSALECYAINFVEDEAIPQQIRNSLLEKVYNRGSQPQEQMPPEQFQQQQLPGGGTGSLNDACLQSGFAQQQCNSYIGSSNPGGYCGWMQAAGLACPKIQDPSITYGDPQGAIQDSLQKHGSTQSAIEGMERLYPPGDLGSGFADD